MALALPAISDRTGGGSDGGVMGLASQLLGMNTSGELYVGVIQSQAVEDRVIERLGLMSVYWDKYLEDARKHLESNTSVSIGARTGIISISVTDKKPERAAAIAKAYVIELNQVLSEVNSSSAHRERVFLEERLREIKQRSEADAKEFALFASQNAAVDIPNQAKAMVTAEAELQSQLIVAQAELKGLRQIYAVGNARARAAQARVDELQRQADKFGGKDVDPAKDASLSNDELYPSLRQLPLLGVKYLDLYRRAKIDDAVFELLTQEYEVAKIQEAREIPTAAVLDAAAVPEKKSSPHRVLLTLAAVLVGFLFACAYLVGCTVWERTDVSEPSKVLAQEVFSTAKAWMERTPVLRNLVAELQCIAIWLPRRAHRGSV
jgi:capsule polysaccharide export protein KpsE/RkpR